MKTLCLLLYLASSVLHLIASFRDDAQARRSTKPFPLLFLLLYYLLAADSPSPFLVLALLASWVGDLLLIPRGQRWFAMGGVFFLLSQLCLILLYRVRISPAAVPLPPVLLAAVVYGGVALFIMRKIRDTAPRALLIPMHVYLLCNGAMNVCALMQLLSAPGPGTAAVCAGALLLFVSDCCLFLVRFYKDPTVVYKKHFTVMLSYLLGELLIVTGTLML